MNGVLDLIFDLEIEEILDILILFSLHSVSACYFIVRDKIFDKILAGIPKTYKILSILAKSSLSAAFKIKQKLADRVLADLLTENSSKDLIYSLFFHNQCYDIRNISNVLCMEGSADMFFLLSRVVNTVGPNEFVSISEISVHKYISQWETYIANKKLIQGICEFLEAFFNKFQKINFELTFLIENLTQMIENSKISTILTFSATIPCKCVKNFNQYLDTEE